MTTSAERWTVRDLPFPVRLVISAFLLSVGIGYFSALVQLHFQHAGPGEPLPGPDRVVAVYHGQPGISELERIITADEHLPFSSSGSMRTAFTSRSVGWKQAIRKQDEKELRRLREAELRAVLAWIHAGYKEDTFGAFPLPSDFVNSLGLKETDLTDGKDGFFEKNPKGALTANVGLIFDTRCARCHDEGKGGPAGQVHLREWEDVKDYCETAVGSGLSLEKLAQSTHVHLLGFSMLYGITGAIFAFSRFPLLVRVVVAPLPLIAQVADISCWWLARADPLFAKMILVTGGVVGMSLAAQILLTLWDLYGSSGRLVVAVLLIVGGLGFVALKTKVIDPHLSREKEHLVAPQQNPPAGDKRVEAERNRAPAG